MTTQNRQLNIKEKETLEEEIRSLSNEFNKSLNWTFIVTLAVITILCAFHIYHYDKSNWSLISKTLVCVCPIGIWVIVENKFKGRRKTMAYINELKSINATSTIQVLSIDIKRVIKFQEKDDEGTLYLIETGNSDCIYLWDNQWLISEDLNFPKEHLEVYMNDNFINAMSSKVNCYGRQIEPITISGKQKWSYFEDSFPADLQKESKTFDEIVTKLKTTA